MAEGAYYSRSQDRYAAFSDIFGAEPPPGRIPGSIEAPPAVQGPMNSHMTSVPISTTTPIPAHVSSSPRMSPIPLQLKMPSSRAPVPTSVMPSGPSTPTNPSGNSEDMPSPVTRSVSQVWTGFKKQVLPQRSASASVPSLQGHHPKRSGITRGGRAIPKRQAAVQDEVRAFSDTANGAVAGAPSRKPSSSTISSLSRSTIVTTSRREPLVYPALLSRVATKFRERIVVGERVKNELSYKQAFTGAEAVSIIAEIVRTPDRNLALLLGRALDAQKLFHDVTYDSRLRDSTSEIYQLTEPPAAVNGVFTLLAECYSPTCTRDRLCYSIACPRRLEQQARLHMKLDPGLSSLTLSTAEEPKEQLWSHSVPPEVVEATPRGEQKRQEVICELIYTERQFVKDLEYLREFWIKPLRRSNHIIPSEIRRDKFIRSVFLNVLEVHAVNLKFVEALSKRQHENPVVYQIADVVVEFAPKFEPYVRYGANQMWAKHEFERERATNPAFARFVAETERLPESRKLEINGFLTKPTTRLARYPLLLESILKHTSVENPDSVNIPTAVSMIREFLSKLNSETGYSENRFALMHLNQKLAFRQGEYYDLRLTDDHRRIIYQGEMFKRPPSQEVPGIKLFLFDNVLLFAKSKTANKREYLRVHMRPIPLELLQLSEGDEVTRRKATHMIRTTVARQDSSKTFPLTFQHIGRRGYDLTLYTDSFQSRKTWAEVILRQRNEERQASDVFTKHVLQAAFFRSASLRVTCVKPFDGGRKMLYGTDTGIYLSDISADFVASSPRLVVQMANVLQVGALDKYRILLVLADKTVHALPLDALESSDPQALGKRAKQVASNVTFFKVDECLGRTLLSAVKSHSLSATIRVYEPANPMEHSSKRPPLRRLLTSQQPLSEGFCMFKPLIEIPSATQSLTYLRSHLCLGCSKGFELLDLETLKIESLLDPADTSLDFVIRRESLRPISLYRIGKEFLLNYSDFSFFINSNGWRSRPDWMIQWECMPQDIILSYPYLVAFDNNFIEIRSVESDLLRVISGDNIRFLHESTHDILYVHENDRGYDEVVSLNFWEKQRRLHKA